MEFILGLLWILAWAIVALISFDKKDIDVKARRRFWISMTILFPVLTLAHMLCKRAREK